MAPLLHIMRHGQGYHSSAVSENGSQIPDPALTPHGEQQCVAARQRFARHAYVELLLASPLRRALRTCAIAFAPGLARGLPILALPRAQEASDAPADTGSGVETLRAEFGGGGGDDDDNDGDALRVDFSHLLDGDSQGWMTHEGAFASGTQTVRARAAALRRWICARPEREAVLVSHGYFIHFLLGEVDDEGQQTTPWWEEAELRSYTFVDGDADASLVETEDSLRSRGEGLDKENESS